MKFSEFMESSMTKHQEMLHNLARQRGMEYDVLSKISYNKNAHPDTLHHLSKSKIVGIRRGVAENPSTPHHVLVRLAFDKDPFVRRGLPKNKKLPDDLVTKLSQDDDWHVRSFMRMRENRVLSRHRDLEESAFDEAKKAILKDPNQLVLFPWARADLEQNGYKYKHHDKSVHPTDLWVHKLRRSDKVSVDSTGWFHVHQGRIISSGTKGMGRLPSHLKTWTRRIVEENTTTSGIIDTSQPIVRRRKRRVPGKL